MDFRFSQAEEGFRQELLDFLRRELPPQWEGPVGSTEENDWDLNLQMRGKLAQKGWLTMHWPKDYGGQQASPLLSLIFNEEMSYHRAPGRDAFGARMLGPTLMIYGTEEQKRNFLPPVARGEVRARSIIQSARWAREVHILLHYLASHWAGPGHPLGESLDG